VGADDVQRALAPPHPFHRAHALPVERERQPLHPAGGQERPRPPREAPAQGLRPYQPQEAHHPVVTGHVLHPEVLPQEPPGPFARRPLVDLAHVLKPAERPEDDDRQRVPHATEVSFVFPLRLDILEVLGDFYFHPPSLSRF